MNKKSFGLLGIIVTIAIITLAGGGSLYVAEIRNEQSLLQVGKEKEKEAQRIKKQIESRFRQMETNLEIFDLEQSDRSSSMNSIDVLFDKAKVYVQAHSAPGMQFELKLKKRVNNWAVFSIIPLNMKTDNAQLFMEYIDDKWELRGFGTAFPELQRKHPELFI